MTLSEVQINNLRAAFTLIDKDGNGSITTEELGLVLQSLGQKATQAEVQELIANADSDANGTVELTEFLTMMERRGTDNDEQLREAFRLYDKDGNGVIDRAELRLVFSNLGENLCDGDVDDLIAQADVNGDGQIDYDEYVRIMRVN